MARTYDDEIFLFGALFHGYDTDEGRIFDWHTKSDLTQVDELTGKIRPIFWWHTVTQIRSNMD